MQMIPQVPARSFRQNATLSIQTGRARQKQLEGAEVVVLVAGRYNGPLHKSLGLCAEGATIRVATGSYLEHILEHGYVRLAGDEPAAATTANAEGAQEAETDQPQQPQSADDLAETGLSKKDVKALGDAGFTGKAAVKQSFGVFGLNEIVAVAGMTEAKARKVVEWAGVELPKE